MEIVCRTLSGRSCPKGIKEAVSRVLRENKAPDDSFVSVVLVGNKEVGDHPVLTFVNQEIKKPFVFPPDNKHYLGEVLINERGRTAKEIVDLARHGALHLVGKHHQ